MDTIEEFAPIRDEAACSGWFDGEEIWHGIEVEIVSEKGKTSTITAPHFSPDPGPDGRKIEQPSVQIARVNEAMKICRTCPVLDRCKKFTQAKPPISTGMVQGGIFFPNVTPIKRTGVPGSKIREAADAKNLQRLSGKTKALAKAILKRNENLSGLIAKARSRKPALVAGLIRNFIGRVTRVMPWSTAMIVPDTPVEFYPDGKPMTAADMVANVLDDDRLAQFAVRHGIVAARWSGLVKIGKEISETGSVPEAVEIEVDHDAIAEFLADAPTDKELAAIEEENSDGFTEADDYDWTMTDRNLMRRNPTWFVKPEPKS